MTIETLHAMPKTEVHLHLEGTVAPETLWDMASRNGVELPAGSLEELRTRYAFESFEPFLELWMAMSRCFRTAADYAQMVDDYVTECTRQNIRYVEAHFTPYNHERFGFGGARALELVTERLLHHEGRGGPVTRLILDIPSESVPESGEFTIDLLERLDNPLVVAIGLGGPEVGFPRIAVEPYFERARRAGYPCVAHAGETEGAHHVHEAVHRLRARRVQHGVRAVEDPEVLALLAERDICCDVTLTSNLFLTCYTDLGTHPLPRMMEAGVPVTLSTDDPPFFGTDLLREYRLAHETLGLSIPDLWQINLNGLRYGLAETGLRRRLLLEFLQAGRKLGLEPGPG
jgi:aminodeoxyfutalosine deaminase